MGVYKRIKNCAGCARRRAKMKAAYEATIAGAKTARQLYLEKVGKAPPQMPAGKSQVTRVVRVRG